MKNIPTPVVQLPEGFTLNSINYVLKGLCPECAAKRGKSVGFVFFRNFAKKKRHHYDSYR